jgi:hypothetical protein
MYQQTKIAAEMLDCDESPKSEYINKNDGILILRKFLCFIAPILHKGTEKETNRETRELENALGEL